jgi:hypothetical protein
MATLAFLLAALLDPVQAALVLVIVLVYRGPQPILVAATVAAAVSETIILMAAFDYTWGELIVPRLASSLVQAAALCWLVGLVRPTRPDEDPRQRAKQFPSEAAAALGSVPTGSASPRLAPWHMRAYVRHRLRRLRRR